MDKGKWYVIQTLKGYENDICNDINDFLDAKLYEYCFVPMSERHHRKGGKFTLVKEALFPGYLFIVSNNIEEVAVALCKISKFKRILRTGESFSPLKVEEVKKFKLLTDENFNVTMSKGFIVGDDIIVTEGPLDGHEGMIKKIDRHKRMAYIDLPFLGREVRVRLPLEIVDKR